MKIPPIAASLALASFVAGCGAEGDLEHCVGATEPTVLLRQLTLSGKQKEMFEWCTRESGFKREFCLTTYLNADTAIRQCMKDHGFTFTPSAPGPTPCQLYDYRDPACYQMTWWLKITDPKRE